jgi:hypothetical protein
MPGNLTIGDGENSSPSIDYVGIAGSEQTAGLVSFRIAVIGRLWHCILVVRDDLFMV